MPIKIFSDGAVLERMRELAHDPRVAGFTTNPSLARAAGVVRYRAFAEVALRAARGKPVSIEVLSDDFEVMGRQARAIAALGENVYVKIPVSNSEGASSAPLITELAAAGVKLNVTTVFTVDQVRAVGEALEGKPSRGRRLKHSALTPEAAPNAPAVVSVFAGRIADAGTDPLAHVTECRAALREVCPRAEMLWASTRQAYDAVLAEKAGCEIITMTPDLLGKLALRGKDLAEYSRETAAMFARDAAAAGFEL